MDDRIRASLSQLLKDLEPQREGTSRKIGYARVSTEDQKLDLQIDALKRDGVAEEDIFTDQCSGATRHRPGLRKAWGDLQKGDTFVVWKLDRFGRSIEHLVQGLKELNDHGIHFRSISEAIDTGTPVGMLLFHLLGAVAQFERDLIRERTREGIKAAKARGVKFGAKTKVEGSLRKRISGWLKAGVSVRDICNRTGLAEQTIYNHFPAGVHAVTPSASKRAVKGARTRPVQRHRRV